MSAPITVIAWSFTKAIDGYLYVYRVMTFGGRFVVGQTALSGDDSVTYVCSGPNTPEEAQREAVLFTETMEKSGFEIDSWPWVFKPLTFGGTRFNWLLDPKISDMPNGYWDVLWDGVQTYGYALEGFEL